MTRALRAVKDEHRTILQAHARRQAAPHHSVGVIARLDRAIQ
jgi:hypothetical protein